MVAAVVFFAPRAFAATISASPASSSVTSGSTFTVNLQLDTTGVGVEGVDVYYLNYNPALLEVQDAVSGTAGIQIQPGSLMPNTTVNSVDATNGKISFSQAANGGSTYNGTGVLATITFKALSAGTASVTLDFSSGSTVDSNVASNGNDVLTAVTNGQYTITGATVPPTTPPPAGGGGGGSPSPSPTPTPSPTPGPSVLPAPANGQPHANQCLINDAGTYYLILNNQRVGIANPGLLFSHGYDFKEAVLANNEDRLLSAGPLLWPGEGALVKKASSPTVFLITGGQKHGFVSSNVFTALGYKFTTVLTVTAPELDAMPVGADISDPAAPHPYGVHINQDGTVYWMGNGFKHGYPSLAVFNSWNQDNDFSHVVPANTADRVFPVGPVITARPMCQ